MTDHLIIDLDGVRPNPIESNTRELIETFLLQCCRLVGMRPLGPPVIYKGSDHLPGYTGFLVIETSHLSVHQFDSGYVRIDLYSCKQFNPDIIVSLSEVYFPADLRNVQTIKRWPVRGASDGG